MPRGTTLFTDDIKVVGHPVGMMFGEGAELYHALHSGGTISTVDPGSVLKEFQAQGPGEVGFRRHTLVNVPMRGAP
jgi:hypothetical protein